MDPETMTAEEINTEWNALGNAGLSLEPRAMDLEAEMRGRCGVIAAAAEVMSG